MEWVISHRADLPARLIADRHYNRQHIGATQFVPPGRCFVLRTDTALWITSWPYAKYVKHQWAGAWVNSCFRREGGQQASVLIRQALAATRWYWPEIPSVNGIAMVTFIDRSKVRKKRDYGRCYRKAGFKVVGETKGGLLALGIDIEGMPQPEPPTGIQAWNSIQFGVGRVNR